MHFLAFCFHCQVLLINAVKDVASALSDLILATKNASGKSSHDPTMTSLKDTAKVWIVSCVVVLCVEYLQWHFHAGAGGGGTGPQIMAAPKFSHTVDTLWSIDCQKN